MLWYTQLPSTSFIHSFVHFSFMDGSVCLSGILLDAETEWAKNIAYLPEVYNLSRKHSDTPGQVWHVLQEQEAHRIQIQSQEEETFELNCDPEPNKKSCRENSRLGSQDRASHVVGTEMTPAWQGHGVRESKVVVVRYDTGRGQDVEVR